MTLSSLLSTNTFSVNQPPSQSFISIFATIQHVNEDLSRSSLAPCQTLDDVEDDNDDDDVEDDYDDDDDDVDDDDDDDPYQEESCRQWRGANHTAGCSLETGQIQFNQ